MTQFALSSPAAREPRRSRVGWLAAHAFIAAALAAPLVSYAGDHPLSSCFWSGPISTKQPTALGEDGARFLWPEQSATYWLARFKRLPAGAHLEIKRDFAYARHESLNAYRTE